MSACVSQYVLKVNGLCDLACDHCYVYEHADQSWQHKPKTMAMETVAQAGRRIGEHAKRHRLTQVTVILHGGEPLLLGQEKLRGMLAVLRSSIENSGTRLRLAVHTNGVRLDETLCDLFTEYDVRVGVSLDGDRLANDRHRRYANGRSSYERALRALDLLRRPEYLPLYAGILCTVDVANDPIAVYEALLAQAPPHLDFLLPHATWDNRPANPTGKHAPYAAWLGRIHTRWVADGRPIPIRFFDSLLRAWEGHPSGSEAVGLDPVDLLVIETGGEWEQADSLKTAFPGAPETGLEVFSHSADEAAAHPGVAARRAGLSGLSRDCRACGLVRACGGGLYAHRYRKGSDFDNRSVYCDDLTVLIPQVIEARGAATIARGRSGPTHWEGEGAPFHALNASDLDSLAAGPGDRTAMAGLTEAMHSVSLALLGRVAAGVTDIAGDLGQAARDGWRLLCTLNAEHPEAVREVVTYPYVQAWATRCLDRRGAGGNDRDCAHLAGVAAAAAALAGVETQVALPVHHGVVCLPAVGALAVESAGPVAVVRVSPSGVTSGRSAGEWLAVRRVTGAGLSITVDDIDLFRDCEAWMPAGRLPDVSWESWRLALPAAVSQLAAELPGYASVLRAGLRSVVPLPPGAAGSRRSATASRAFAAVAVALPGDTCSLSELLLHEMQHVKLAALIRQFDLFVPGGGLFQVPWRPDPRPFDGLLHGAYAHLAIADLWRARAAALPDERNTTQYRAARSWVEDAIGMLLTADRLLPAGERFVAGMRATVRGWARP